MALYGLAHFLSHGEGGDVAGDLFAMGLIGTVLAVMMTSTSHSMKRRGGTCAVLALVAGLVIHYGSCPRAGCAWAPGATPAGPAGPRR